MVTIKQMLVDHHLLFHDKHLQWGATLSEYKDCFNNQELFVGIELTEDIQPPEHYIAIDHHNHKAQLPSAIEQVSTLLDITLNRLQQLVAANDRGYIPALVQMGASRLEIDEIRLADRKAQGVTDEDEKSAIESISKNSKTISDLLMIDSLTPRFSTITDRLFPYSKLLISYRDQFVYYGKGITKLATHYQNLIHQHKAYYGGGDPGFFGLAEGAFQNKDAENIKIEVINLMKEL